MIITFKSPVTFVANLKACLLAVGQDDSRAMTAGILITARKGVARFVSTNGHWLLANEVSVDCDGEGEILIHRDDAKRIVKMIDKSKKAATWAVELDTAGKVSQLSQSVEFKPWPATFPPYAQIVTEPSKLGGERIVAGFDGRYMAAIGEAFSLICEDERAAPMTMHTSEDGKWSPEPIVFVGAPNSKGAWAMAILMPYKAVNGATVSATPVLERYRAEHSKEKAA